MVAKASTRNAHDYIGNKKGQALCLTFLEMRCKLLFRCHRVGHDPPSRATKKIASGVFFHGIEGWVMTHPMDRAPDQRWRALTAFCMHIVLVHQFFICNPRGVAQQREQHNQPEQAGGKADCG